MRRMIFFVVVLLTLIPTIFVGIVVSHYAQTVMKTEKMDALKNIAHMVDSSLTTQYCRLITEIKLKTEADAIRNILEEGATDFAGRRQAELILTEPVGFPVLGGSVIDAKGKVILSSRAGETGLMLNETELYQSIVNGASSYNGAVTVNDVMDVFEIAVPIRDKRGNLIGILRQTADLNIVSQYLGNIHIGKSGHVFLIRKNGFMIFGQGLDDPTILYHEYQNNSSLEQIVADFKSGKLKTDRGTVSYVNEGVYYIGVYEKIKSIDCIAVAAMDREEMSGAMVNIVAMLVPVILLAAAVIAVFGFLIGRMHIVPLKIINNTIKMITDGDLTARSCVKESSPFIELSRSINHLADSYQKNEKELRMSSRIDNLTHLPNRTAIYEVLDTLLYKHPKQALLLLDLDGFKDVNDSLGYDIGDRILMEVGDILRGLPQHVCYPSRLGGAEFLVFITNWTAPKYPERIAEKIISKIESIRFIDEIRVDVSVNIGIEYTETEKIDKKKLIKYSNIAMHKARSNGKNSYFVHYPYLQKEQ